AKDVDQPGGRTQNLLIARISQLLARGLEGIVVRRLAIGPTGLGKIQVELLDGRHRQIGVHEGEETGLRGCCEKRLVVESQENSAKSFSRAWMQIFSRWGPAGGVAVDCGYGVAGSVTSGSEAGADGLRRASIGGERGVGIASGREWQRGDMTANISQEAGLWDWLFHQAVPSKGKVSTLGHSATLSKSSASIFTNFHIIPVLHRSSSPILDCQSAGISAPPIQAPFSRSRVRHRTTQRWLPSLPPSPGGHCTSPDATFTRYRRGFQQLTSHCWPS
ncbi:hypothetical protein CNYM01_10957, partial [Colletotrichum nymphaeae SA-01]